MPAQEPRQPGRPPKTAELLSAIGTEATTAQVAATLGVSQPTAFNRLERAAKRGEVARDQTIRPAVWRPARV